MTIETDEENQLAIFETDIKNRLESALPALYWNNVRVVDNKTTRLAIDDLSYRAQSSIQDDVAALQLASRGWLEVYDATLLTNTLAEKMHSFLETLNRKKSLLIFPGNGSQVVRDLLPEDILKGVTSVCVPTRRIVNSKTGAVEGVEIGEKNTIRKRISENAPETIIVFDDVIVTGTTLTTIQQIVPLRKAEWFAAALMTLSPLQKRSRPASNCGIQGYKSVITPIVYQGTIGIPPLNSISTLIGESKKSQTVREQYIEKYVEDKSVFLMAVKQIREKLRKE